jgi:hypothetical protein
MPSKLYVDEIRGKFTEHTNTFSEDHVVEANYNSLLIGPVNLTGKITVEENAALTVFGEINVGNGTDAGELVVDGTLDIR